MMTETIEGRLKRLIDKPSSADLGDVQWMALEFERMNGVVKSILKNTGPRCYGLREAAGLLEASAQRDHKIRFIAGKREQNMRAVNSGLLRNVARVIRLYADDVESGKIGGEQVVVP